ncbi:MAG: phosphotransferase [Acidobacteriota bacterium]
MNQSGLSREDLAAALAAFAIDGELREVRPHGTGHIHDSFVATLAREGRAEAAPKRYLLQRLNQRVFADLDRVVENIAQVTAHVRRALAVRGENHDGRAVLQLVPARAGGFLWRNTAGDCFRTYDFIERSVALERPQTPEQAFEAARTFAQFQRALGDYSGPPLFEVLPAFHNTPRRLADLVAAVDRDEHGRAALAKAEICEALAEEALASSLIRLRDAGDLPERITHNDTKLNNVLFDERTGRGLCVTDLDTVMPGLGLYDFGDLVRSAATNAAEDEPDSSRIDVKIDIFQALARGWIAGAGTGFLRGERERMVLAGRLLSYELGVRFLTDFLDGDRYFKTGHTGQNLARCRSQFAMARSLARHEETLQRWIESI